MMAGPCEGDEGTGGLQEATLGASVSMISKRETGELLRMREPGGLDKERRGTASTFFKGPQQRAHAGHGSPC
jgi:hypothetical protein